MYVCISGMCLIRSSVLLFDHFYDPHGICKAAAHFCRLLSYELLPALHALHAPPPRALPALTYSYNFMATDKCHFHFHFAGTFHVARQTLCTLCTIINKFALNFFVLFLEYHQVDSVRCPVEAFA